MFKLYKSMKILRCSNIFSSCWSVKGAFLFIFFPLTSIMLNLWGQDTADMFVPPFNNKTIFVTSLLLTCIRVLIMKTRLFKYTENFTTKKKWKKIRKKNSDTFHISAKNIDCGHSLEPPRRGGSNDYPQSMFLSRNKNNKVYPCKPQFYYIKGGLMG